MKWISVKDRLPKHKNPVLCYMQWEYNGRDEKKMPIVEVHPLSDNSLMLLQVRGCTVTHWAELPEKPNEMD